MPDRNPVSCRQGLLARRPHADLPAVTLCTPPSLNGSSAGQAPKRRMTAVVVGVLSDVRVQPTASAAVVCWPAMPAWAKPPAAAQCNQRSFGRLGGGPWVVARIQCFSPVSQHCYWQNHWQPYLRAAQPVQVHRLAQDVTPLQFRPVRRVELDGRGRRSSNADPRACDRLDSASSRAYLRAALLPRRIL